MTRRRFAIPHLIRPLLLVVVLGTLGYMIVEGASLLDALYMTIITVTTVGYREVFPLGPAGKILTMLVVLVGLGAVLFGMGEYFATVRNTLDKRGLMHAIERMSAHYIVCGFGRVGQNAALALRDAGRSVLVVEKDPARAVDARRDQFLVVEGDPTHDEVMQRLGVDRAAGFVACTGSDPDNLFIVLSARTLNQKMHIVARAADAGSVAKFKRAGADRVVSPYEAGGRYMANSLVRPNLTEFLDRVTLGGVELWLEEIVVPPGSPLAGRTIGEADVAQRTGASVIALHRKPADFMPSPAPTTRLLEGDALIALGTKDQLARVEQVARG